MSTVAIGVAVPGGVGRLGNVRVGAVRGSAGTAAGPRLRLVGAAVASAPTSAGAVVAPPATVLRLTSRGRVVLVLLVALLITLTGLVTSRAFAGSPARALEVQSYVVQAGDTLWQLAAERSAPGEDVRDVVLELQRLNGLPEASLTAGERLILPLSR